MSDKEKQSQLAAPELTEEAITIPDKEQTSYMHLTFEKGPG